MTFQTEQAIMDFGCGVSISTCLIIAWGICFNANLAWQFINNNPVFVVGALLFGAITHFLMFKRANTCLVDEDNAPFNPHPSAGDVLAQQEREQEKASKE